MKKLIIIRKFIAYLWLLIGGAKVLAVLTEIATGKELISPVMNELVNHTTIGFYKEIGNAYYLAYPLLFIALAGIIEFTSSLLFLRGGKTAKLGLLGYVMITILYLPYHEGPILITNSLTIIAYLFLLKYPYEENLLQK